MEIVLLTEDDVAAFRELRLQALADTPTAYGSSVADFEALSEETIRSRMQPTENSFIYAAKQDGKLVGMAGFFRETHEKLRHIGNIWGVFVAPEVRGQGVGRQLMQAVLTHIHTLDGLRQVRLSVESTNVSARRLYRSLGFVTYGVEPDVLYVNGHYYDEDHMILRLDHAL
jgi:RimJ/RimL family protein N-acetyltransferase